VVARLTTHHACVTVDLPGFGESPPLAAGSRDPGRLATELEALRGALGLADWHLVGHDAGAALAVHYAAHYPDRVRRLALISPPVFPDFTPPWFFRLLRRSLVGDLVAPLAVFAIWNGGIQALIERPDPAMDEILAAFRRPFRGLAGARRLTWLLRWGEPAEVLGETAALLPSVAAPTLVFHGRRDGAIPTRFAERAAATIPDARLLLFDSGHFLPLNLPDVVADHLERFFADERRDDGPALSG
jgi:pimeloyl-ACP methyl ester carboxylesterase